MNSTKASKIWALLGGLSAGIINGLLGAAGGLAVVPALKKAGASVQEAHATSIAVILPISAVSALLYRTGGNLKLSAVVPYLPGAVIGALLGAWLLKKLPPDGLRRLFGGLMIWAGVRLFFR